ncbi:MAG: DUF3343 domain-containing protein [Bacilli bacterium]
MKYLVTFPSTAYLMKAENVFKKNNIDIEISPIPAKISSGCGLCILFNDINFIINAIKENEYTSIYHNNDEFISIYK